MGVTFFPDALNLSNGFGHCVVSAMHAKIHRAVRLSHFGSNLMALIFLFGYFATAAAFGARVDRFI